MLREMTYRTLEVWSRYDLCARQKETSRVTATSAQVGGRLGQQLGPLHCSAGDLVLYSHISDS